MKNERLKEKNDIAEKIPNIKNHLASEDKVYGVKSTNYWNEHT